MGNSRAEDNQEIGHGHVCKNHVCGSLLVARQDWIDAVEEKDDVTQRLNHHLWQKDGFHSHLLLVSQGIFVKRPGEDFRGSWGRKEAVPLMTSAVSVHNQHCKGTPTLFFSWAGRHYHTPQEGLNLENIHMTQEGLNLENIHMTPVTLFTLYCMYFYLLVDSEPPTARKVHELGTMSVLFVNSVDSW